jgi:hypothetical protein
MRRWTCRDTGLGDRSVSVSAQRDIQRFAKKATKPREREVKFRMIHKVLKRIGLSLLVLLIFFVRFLDKWLSLGYSIKHAFCWNVKIFLGPLYTLPINFAEKDYASFVSAVIFMVVFFVIQWGFVVRGGRIRACLAVVFWLLWLVNGLDMVVLKGG